MVGKVLEYASYLGSVFKLHLILTINFSKLMVFFKVENKKITCVKVESVKYWVKNV